MGASYLMEEQSVLVEVTVVGNIAKIAEDVLLTGNARIQIVFIIVN